MLKKNDENSKKLVKDIFLEEKYVEKEIKETAVYIDPENYLNYKKLLLILTNFYNLNFLEQKGYLKHIKEILNTLSSTNIQKLIEKLYKTKLDNSIINKKKDLFIELLDVLPIIMSFMSEFLYERKKSTKKAFVPFKEEELKYRTFRSRSSICTNFENDTILPTKENEIKKSILEFIKKMLLSEKSDIKKKSIRILKDIIKYFNQKEKDEKIIVIVIDLLKMTQKENIDKLILGLELLKINLEYFSNFIIEEKIIPYITKLMKSKKQLIEEHSLLVFIEIINKYPDSYIIKNYLKTIRKLFKKSNQNINLILLRNIDRIFNKFDIKTLRKHFLDDFYNILNSPNKLIKKEFFKNISKFIITMLKNIRKEQLNNIGSIKKAFKIYFNIHKYIEDYTEKTKQYIIEKNYKDLHTIFELFGKTLWPYLKYLLEDIDKYTNKKIINIVKMSLIKNLANSAEILGQEIVEKELIYLINTSFLTLSKTTSVKVKTATISYLYKILAIIGKEQRKKFADYYLSLQDQVKKWRVRYTLSQQMVHILDLFDADDIISYICPLFFYLCQDSYAIVRKNIATKFSLLVTKVAEKKPEFLFIIFDKMKEFYYSNTYIKRQTFLALFENLMEFSLSYIDKDMKNAVISLCNDKVVNVRIKLALVIKKAFALNKLRILRIQVCVRLSKETDRDVKKVIDKIKDKI